ncbi:TonB-dependent receptor [Bryobacter aggregatus]|uniref:TonB-dependent receptor n=1 Tax=Bryobacter aggregatus TaxID=360054 RepID=UPI0005683EF5|nr:TonB-dependent receptor [Bryobacter aggregatus]
MLHNFRFVLQSLVILTMAISSLSAQTATGTLEGRVTDATGAVVPDAKVVITAVKTNTKQELTTNSGGSFVRPFLLPGVYQVSVEKQGFRRYAENNVQVSVQQTVSLDILLTLGDATTTVEVSAASAQLSPSSSTVSTVIGNKAIMDLPLNGRNPFALASLVPGVTPGGGSTPWISGGRNSSSEITIDGTSVILPENNVGINTLAYTPPVDTVQEFSIVTNALAAEYGRTGGGTINVSTRSGGNDWHGSAYEFLRNSKLDANNFFSNRSRTPLGAFQRNQFGGTFGGPINIPGVYKGKDRTFFFLSEQSTVQRSASLFTTTVPTTAWLNGDFSNLKNASGQAITIYDPLTATNDGTGNYLRTAFPGNVIPTSRMDPVAVKAKAYYVPSTQAPNNVNTNANNFFGASKSPSSSHQFDTRVDHSFSQKFTIFGRFSYNISQSSPVNFFGNPGTPSGDGPSQTTNYNASLNANYTLNPTTIINFNYGFGRFNNVRFPFSTGFDTTQLGFPVAIRNQAATQNLEFPRFDISGVSSLGQATFTTLRFIPFSHVFAGSVTKVLTKHTIKAGGEYRQLFLNFMQLGNPAGQYTFNQGFTQRNPTTSVGTEGFGFASFLLGTPASGSVSHDPIPASSSVYWGGYIQDDYKMTAKLTLNIGLRYDVDLPRTERYNRYSYFDIFAPSPIAGLVPGYPNLRGSMNFVNNDHRYQTNADRNNFSPRLGFAYRLGEKTIMRGAYALMYAGSMMQAAGSSGSAGMEGYRGSTGMLPTLDGGRTVNAYLANPYPNGFNLPLGSVDNPRGGGHYTNLGLGVGESFFNDSRNPVIQQWNFNLQHQLSRSLLVEAGYLASKGNHLIDGEGNMTYNQLPASYGDLGNALNDQVPNPFYGIITNPTSALSQPNVSRSQLLRPYPQYTSVNAFRKPQANSIYHAFTARVEKRYANGFGFLGSFTAGKLIDDASQTVTFLGQAGNKQDFYNRKAERSISAQDIAKRLVVSGNYDLPFGKGRKLLSNMHPAAEALIGGWQMNGILTLSGGTPVLITQNVNNTGLGSSGQRPNNNGTTGNRTGLSRDQQIAGWFDTSVFSFAPAFRFGNVSRTSPDIRNPGLKTLDYSLFKNFRFFERATLQFRAEAFNLTNTVNFSAPNAQLGSGSTGTINSTAVSPRQVQLALRLSF